MYIVDPAPTMILSRRRTNLPDKTPSPVFSQVLEVEVANIKVGVANALPPFFLGGWGGGGGEAGYAGVSGKFFRIRPSKVHFEAI